MKRLKNIVICGKKLGNIREKLQIKFMIKWIIYIVVSLILIFVSYLAILGINRGVDAKNKNIKSKSPKKNIDN